ncbi:hypothetical protein [Nitrosopumilus maritimus]|uniref:Uncharacterized protein n=1 Tax=Nitrosopumilus maritimus (strain SCM1) TaxID=436308 RepID=A9A2N0_NITMS|nr:hypothetical protein [Nitrosopumilus maritimus]ABX13269.1 hypothetical protein Nmar_1373 [Nitrosopumilus maritimus SCM1]
MAKSAGLIPTAVIQGFSLGILMRFNIDITPAGILKMISPALEPLVVEQTAWIIPVVLLVLTILPIIAIIKIFQRFGILGIIVYAVIAIGVWYLVMTS